MALRTKKGFASYSNCCGININQRYKGMKKSGEFLFCNDKSLTHVQSECRPFDFYPWRRDQIVSIASSFLQSPKDIGHLQQCANIFEIHKGTEFIKGLGKNQMTNFLHII